MQVKLLQKIGVLSIHPSGVLSNSVFNQNQFYMLGNLQLNWRSTVFSIFTFCAMFCYDAGAQTTTISASGYSATIDTAGVVLITSVKVLSSYKADISNMGFSNEKEAVEYFMMRNDNLVSFTVNWAAREVDIEVQALGTFQSWEVKDWNKYFYDKSKWY